MRQISAPGRYGHEMPPLFRHVIDLGFNIRTIARATDDFVFRGRRAAEGCASGKGERKRERQQ